jgi:hypothetical protein
MIEGSWNVSFYLFSLFLGMIPYGFCVPSMRIVMVLVGEFSCLRMGSRVCIFSRGGRCTGARNIEMVEW